MAGPTTPATPLRRWLIDKIYGQPSSGGFWGAVIVGGVILLFLLFLLSGVPFQSREEVQMIAGTEPGTGIAGPPVVDDDAYPEMGPTSPDNAMEIDAAGIGEADDGVVNSAALAEPRTTSSFLYLRIGIAGVLLIAFPWLVWRHWRIRTYYRRMYGSYYDRP